MERNTIWTVLRVNALFVQTVRSTGGNNTKRFLNIASVGESVENLEYLELPKDNKLIVQVHYYFTPPDMIYGWDEETNSNSHALDKRLGNGVQQTKMIHNQLIIYSIK